ncbi:MAG: hypothetical protein KJ737_22155 [Proteobacteria bacterium]|nr:hypothetical protein [Pseudomonadota bacterium]
MSGRKLTLMSTFILVAISGFLSGCRPFQTSPPDGPYLVGVNVQNHMVGDHEVQFTTWYPAQYLPGVAPYMTEDLIIGTAVLNADFDSSGGPYPLIVFDPGFGASGNQYYFYTQNLASHGYVVIGIDPLDKDQMTDNLGKTDPKILSLALSESYKEHDANDAVRLLFQDWWIATDFGMTYRPAEIEYAKQLAVNCNQDPSSIFYGMIDTENIGMTGHSLGAWYSLLEGGMPFNCDYELTPEECDVNQVSITDLDPCCMASIAGLVNPLALKDDRIKAILPLAPPILMADSQITRSAAELDIPVMFIAGDDPANESTFEPMWEVYTNAANPKYFVQIRDTDHFVVFDIIETLKPWVQNLIPGGNHTYFLNKARAYKDYSSAFFNMYLKGDTSGLSTMHHRNQYFVKKVWYQD